MIYNSIRPGPKWMDTNGNRMQALSELICADLTDDLENVSCWS